VKVKAIILLFLAISLSLAANCAFFMVSAASSTSLPLNSGTAAAQSAPDPVSFQNFPNNITISGNLNLTGNSVVDLAGISSSHPVNVYLNGSIFINDNATLVLKYANLFFVGATEPYGRNITMSNPPDNHPRLNITAASIYAYTASKITIGSVTNPFTHKTTILTAVASYGAAIYAYDNSEISANGLVFNRTVVYNYTVGGPTKIECHGGSSVSLSNIKVDSLLTYDAANVTIYTGAGALKSGKSTRGIVLRCYNASTVSLYNVSFLSLATSDETRLLFDGCTEIGTSITIAGRSIVDFTDKTALNPVIEATDNSYVSLSSLTLAESAYGATDASISDNATFAVQNGATVTGWILAFDNSRVIFNGSGRTFAEGSPGVVCRNSSSVLILNSILKPLSIPVLVSLFDSSELSMVNSTISGGIVSFFNDTSAYISGSTLDGSGSGLQIALQDNTNITMVGSTIRADSLDMSDNASLSLEDSNVWLINCLDSSQVSVGNSSIVSELSAYNSAKVRVFDSTLIEFSLTEPNVTGSVSGLTSFIKNSTLALSGSTLNVSLLNTKVNVGFSFSGNSNVTISNSTLSNLSLSGSSIVTLYNASVSASPYVLGDSRVFAYSSLKVRCVDYFGNPLTGSVVTIGGLSGTPPTGITDKNGLASFVVFSEFDNATARFPVGTLTVKGSFGGVSASEDLSASSMGKQVTLSLPLPAWTGYILPLVILVVIVALLIVLYYVVKRVRGKKE